MASLGCTRTARTQLQRAPTDSWRAAPGRPVASTPSLVGLGALTRKRGRSFGAAVRYVTVRGRGSAAQSGHADRLTLS